MSETEALQKRFAAALMPNYGLPPLAHQLCARPGAEVHAGAFLKQQQLVLGGQRESRQQPIQRDRFRCHDQSVLPVEQTVI
jgi:hypothetical protein